MRPLRITHDGGKTWSIVKTKATKRWKIVCQVVLMEEWSVDANTRKEALRGFGRMLRVRAEDGSLASLKFVEEEDGDLAAKIISEKVQSRRVVEFRGETIQ